VESFPLLLAKISEYQGTRAAAPPPANNDAMAVIVGVVVAIVVTLLISFWGIFQKAGRPGWHALVPVFNNYVWIKILGRPGWLAVLALFPYINIVLGMFLCTDTAKSFGKKTGFAIGLMFLPFIFFPILAFGSARYLGPATDDTRPTTIG
jgi:hypothetical protein